MYNENKEVEEMENNDVGTNKNKNLIISVMVCIKYARQFILEKDEIEYDYKVLCNIHRLTCDKLVLDSQLGRIRTTSLGMVGKLNFLLKLKLKKN